MQFLLLAACCVLALSFTTLVASEQGPPSLSVEDPYGGGSKGGKMTGGKMGGKISGKMTGGKMGGKMGTGKNMSSKMMNANPGKPAGMDNGKGKTSGKPREVMAGSSSACSSFTSCSTCTSSHSFTGTCRWCPTDNTCHDHGSLLNQCSAVENYDDPKMCTCKCAQGCGGVPASACSWYSTASATLSDDSSKWSGADFLPTQYTNAATCACSGGGLALWNAPIVPCVRQHILLGHQAMPDAMKRSARAAKLNALSGISTTPIIEYLYQVHYDAYQTCGCPGTPAPFPTWELLYDSPQITPISCSETPSVGVLWLILQFGRCGCGW